MQKLKLGLYAKESSKEKELLFSIPDDLIITWNMVVYHSDVTEFMDKFWARWGDETIYDQAYYDQLALWLLYHKYQIDDSPWKPWLDVLPDVEDFDTIIFWRNSELKEIQGSELYNRAVLKRKTYYQKYEWIQQNIFAAYPRVWKTEPSEEQWKWAVSVVRSTNVQLYTSDGIFRPALIPMMDMMRHEIVELQDPISERDIWTYDDERPPSQVVHITSLQNYNADDEVKLMFVEKCNSELLDFYGFIPERNPNDCVHIELELSTEDPLFNEHNILYSVQKPDPSKLKLFMNGITEEVIKGVRAVTISQYDLQSDMLLNGVPDESLGLLSDFGIAEYIATLCRKYYQAFTSSEDEDKVLLMDPELPYRVQLAIQFRLGEREILRRIGSHYYNQGKNLLKQLEQMGSPNDINRKEEL